MTTAAGEHFDVAIIGGGIHGAGVAQAAAAAGYRALLLERRHWAAATSQQSSKLIHGGLRYLESAQLQLVYHSLHERQLLLRNAPELVKPVRFFIPVYRQTRRRPWQIRAGLSLYALLSGLSPLGRFRALPRREWPALGALRQQDLQAVFQYWDAQTDDAALTRAVVASAGTLQAHCVECSELLSAEARAGGGYVLNIDSNGARWHCTTTALVNAAGPWVNDVLARCAQPQRPLSWVQGSHILLPAADLPGIFYVEAIGDGRAVFVMPWRNHTLVGTTELEVDKPQAQPSQAEIDYLLATLRHYFPEHPQTLQGSFAGVRVLPTGGGKPFSRARESLLEQSAGVISIFGGKLTTYRHTAEEVMALLRPLLGARAARADTRTLALRPVAEA
jgi:glycerol-3-phosphate dehydrogenase